MARHRIDLTAPERRPVTSTPLRSGPKAYELNKAQIDRMLRMNSIQPAEMILSVTNSICPRKVVSTGLGTDSRKLEAKTFRMAYPSSKKTVLWAR